MKVLRILPFLLICLTQITFAQLVWPGDVNNNGIVNEVDLLTLGKAFGTTGQSRGNTSSDWAGQEVPQSWEGSFPNGLSYAYADCNGDGRINGQDVKVIEDNFGLKHDDVPFVLDEILPGIPGLSPSFEILSTDLGINPNEKEKQIDLSLGNALIPVNNITGLSFLVKLDPNAYDVQATDFKFDGWLQNGNIQVIKRTVPQGGRSAPGDFIVAYTVTDGSPISSIGNGLIGSIVVSPSITELDVLDLRITIDSITMVDENLMPIPVLGTQITPFIPDIFLPNNTDIDTTICQGDTLVFNEQELTTSGMYRDTFTNQHGLDSFINLTLLVADTFQTILTESICQGATYTFNNQNLTTGGTYRDTLTTSNDCDSFIVLNLLVNDTVQTILTESICQGAIYTFNNQNLTTGGTYRDTLATSNGCDSFIVLNLLVNDSAQTILAESICQGATYTFNNQHLTIGGTYRDTLTASSGCDSFLVLNLTIKDTIQVLLNENICIGESYLFNGQNLTSGGIYRDTLQASIGCDSFLVLNLTINNPAETIFNESICQGGQVNFNGQSLTSAGTYRDTLQTSNGCDSLLILNLSVLQILETNTNQTICTGSQLFFNGSFINTTGVYRDTLMASIGCDSIIVFNLTVADVSETNLSTTLCEGNSILFNGQGLTSSGLYRDTLSGDSGCDSILILNLQVLPAFENRRSQTICVGETIVFNGNTLATTGIYHDTLEATNGCDSLLTLDLTIGDAFETVFNTRICEGANLTFNGQVLSESGTYRDTLPTANGCDSVLVLNLVVNEQFETVINETICAGDTYFFNNLTLTNSGTYEVELMAKNGCDSTVTLNLTVGSIESTILQTSICEGETQLFNNQSFNIAGTYFDTLQTVNGCDSFIQLNLTVLPISETIIDTIVCPGDTVIFLNFVLTTETTYWTTFTAANGCDSSVVLNLIFDEITTTNLASTLCPGDTTFFNGQAITESGNYIDTLQNRIGCDSIVTLDLTMEPNCQTTSLSDVLIAAIDIYPNPTTDRLFVVSPSVDITALRVMNITGQVLYQQNALSNTDKIEVDMRPLLPGIYWVLLQTEYGLVQRKVVKL